MQFKGSGKTFCQVRWRLSLEVNGAMGFLPEPRRKAFGFLARMAPSASWAFGCRPAKGRVPDASPSPTARRSKSGGRGTGGSSTGSLLGR